MEEIFEHLNIFSYILLILNPITEGLNFLPSHDWGVLWSISRLLANIIEEEVSLTKTLWKEKIELYILILLVTENFFTYNDCLLLLSEMNNLETSLNFKYFNLNTLIPALFDDQNNFFTWNTSLYLHLNKLINTNPAANPTFPVHQFTENQKFYDFFSDQICHKKTKECNLNSARRLDNLSLDIGNEFYKIFFFTQLFFLNLAILFFKKKIFFFFLINFLIFALMLINLVKLATATNLIYSLIHFLFFAILSGLMIIFWGSTYIGFCVLLIYGAAIPVLALYIIMLVNVDLIQRLFFIEHTTNKTFFSRLKFAILLTIGFFGIFIVIYQLLNYKPSDFIIDHLQTMLFYLLLSKWYLKTTNISYSTESIYDLPLTFYYSDIDKVASAAFWFSYNELIALVLLLLISIIVVIGISWSSKKNWLRLLWIKRN